MWVCSFSSTAVSEKHSDSSLPVCTSHPALWTVASPGLELHPHAVLLLQVQSEVKPGASYILGASAVLVRW